MFSKNQDVSFQITENSTISVFVGALNIGHLINKPSSLFFKLIMKITLILVIHILINFGCQISWAATSGKDYGEEKSILSLRECIQIAIQNSSELEMNRDNQMIAKLRLEDAEAYKKWPQIDLSLGWIYTDKSDPVFDSDTVKGTISVSHSILDFFNNGERMWESIEGVTRTEIEREQKKSALYLAVGKAYFNLLLTQKQFELEDLTLDQLDRNMQKVETMHQNGIASEFELIQAQTEFSKAKISREQKKQLLQLAEMTLTKTIGISLEKRVQVSEIDPAKPFLMDWDQSEAYALNHRQEFILHNKLLKQLPYYRKLIKRGHWPTLSANIFFGDDFESIEFDEKANAGIGLVISKPIFDGGITKRKMQQSEIKLQIVKNSIINFRKTYLNNLKILYIKLINSKSLIQKVKTQRNLEFKIADLYRRRYELRAVTLKEILDSQNNVKKFENDYSRMLIDHMKLEYILKVLMGMNPLEEDF